MRSETDEGLPGKGALRATTTRRTNDDANPTRSGGRMKPIERIGERDGWICQGCGDHLDRWTDDPTMRGEKWATLDHRDPDGGNSDENLWLLCNLCNGSKGTKGVAEWETSLTFTGTLMRRGFTTVPNALLENATVTVGARMTLMCLMSFAWKGHPYPGQARLGEMLGVSDRTIREYLSELVDKGYLVIQRRGRGKTNVYRLTDEFAKKAPEDSSDAVSGDRKQGSALDRKQGSGKEDEVEKDQTEDSSGALPSGEVRRVYDHWREARKKTRVSYDVMSPARSKKIRARLREFSVEDLCAAIDAVALDPWPDRQRHDDLPVIFRSREQVDKFLELVATTRTGRRVVPPAERARQWIEAVGWEYPRGDLIEELGRYILTAGEMEMLMAVADKRRLAA